MRSGYWRNGLVYLLILAAIALLLWQVMGRANAPEKMTVTGLAQLIKEGRVQQVSTTDEKIEVTYTSSGKQVQAVAYKEMGVGLLETLQGLGVTDEDLQGVVVEAVPPPTG